MCTTISSLVSKECGTTTTTGFEVLDEDSLRTEKEDDTYTGPCLGTEKSVHYMRVQQWDFSVDA